VGRWNRAGLWAGGILAPGYPAATRRLARPRGPPLLDRFSPVALAAFCATVLLGGIQALQRLGRPGALLHTGYGQVLLLKLLVVAAMVPLSLLAWRRRLAPAPKPRWWSGWSGWRRSWPSPPPPRPAPTVTAPAEPAGAALPRAGDVALAQPAGQVLIGLTVRPARPGRTQLLLHLLPLDGEQAAARLPAALELGGRTITPPPCGPACREATATLHGGETLRVAVGGPGGGTASFRLPRLLAPDGAALLARAQRRMHTLRTVSLTERLSWGVGATSARYQMQAPNHLRILTAGGAETVIIGETRYGRDAPGKPWKVQHDLPITPAPPPTCGTTSPRRSPPGSSAASGSAATPRESLPSSAAAARCRCGSASGSTAAGWSATARCSPKATSWTTTTTASTPPPRSGHRRGRPSHPNLAPAMSHRWLRSPSHSVNP
jgi:hypothetical protein